MKSSSNTLITSCFGSLIISPPRNQQRSHEIPRNGAMESDEFPSPRIMLPQPCQRRLPRNQMQSVAQAFQRPPQLLSSWRPSSRFLFGQVPPLPPNGSDMDPPWKLLIVSLKMDVDIFSRNIGSGLVDFQIACCFNACLKYRKQISKGCWRELGRLWKSPRINR